MKLELLLIGKTSSKAIEELCIDYQKRLGHYVSFEMHILELPKKLRKKANELQLEEEGKMILNKVSPSDRLILLDEKGKEKSSEGLAQFLQTEMNRGPKSICFCIGGAYGFSQEVYSRADAKLSLSKLTFTHQMVRLIFIEQLYRAMTILKGEKYHH